MPDTTTVLDAQVLPRETASEAASPAERRKRLFAIFGAVIVVAALATGLWFWLTANHITTDNAYVDADLVQVTPLYGGPVAASYVSNTDVVKKGQLLVQLDSADAKLALAQAQAQLGQVERKVQGYFANDAALGGQVNSRDADIAHAAAQVASAESDFTRA